MFSEIPKDSEDPLVPVPAPAKISPVGFSSTSILIILVLSTSLDTTSGFTDLKMPRDLILLNDLLTRISLNGSPSSAIN